MVFPFPPSKVRLALLYRTSTLKSSPERAHHTLSRSMSRDPKSQSHQILGLSSIPTTGLRDCHDHQAGGLPVTVVCLSGAYIPPAWEALISALFCASPCIQRIKPEIASMDNTGGRGNVSLHVDMHDDDGCAVRGGVPVHMCHSVGSGSEF